MGIRNYIDIVEGIFSRKKSPADWDHPPEPDRYASLQDDPVQHARNYRSAEQYARDNNSYDRSPTNPPHLRARAEQEHARLVAQWKRWKSQGMLG
jgi:hypothetical protein